EASAARAVFLAAGAEGNPDIIDWDHHTIVGTCQQLEKRYLRLTSAPNPATVRPLPVLRKTLAFLEQKWREEGNYVYICNQFKSLRQDLTVQRIKNDLTMSVYETHARIALERADLGEYNQCQSQLKALYARLRHIAQPAAVDEFTAYRLLYLVHTRNTSGMPPLASAPAAPAIGPMVQFALAVRHAVAIGDYHAFFRLYALAPKMAPYLMDHMLERERLRAAVALVRASRP
ncbi:hypothetical protein CXG81DRAFT_4323, partial [Caulochytrium protostelioides]